MSTENNPLTAEEMLKSARSGVAVVGGLREAVVSLSQVEAILRIQAHQTAEKDARIKELESWKTQQMEVTGPLYEYGQSKESGVGLGESIFAAALTAWKEVNAVKKERDSIKGTVTKSWVALTFERNEHKKVRDQRDALKKQLEAWENFKCQLASYLMETDYKCTGADVSDFVDEFAPRIASLQTTGQPAEWPFDLKWFKEGPDRMRELVKAGALIVAEIERLQRAQMPTNETAAKEGGSDE